MCETVVKIILEMCVSQQLANLCVKRGYPSKLIIFQVITVKIITTMNIIHNHHNETIKQLFIIFFKQSMKGPVLNLIYLISVPLAYSAGVFFGRANVLLVNAPCWNSKLRGESGASIFSPLPFPPFLLSP